MVIATFRTVLWQQAQMCVLSLSPDTDKLSFDLLFLLPRLLKGGL
jgi:hypothetical protein